MGPVGSALAASDPRDPWEDFNRSIFEFNENIDKYSLKPVAQAYQALTPDLADRAITNFFGNLRDVQTLANEILQLKPLPAIRTLSRIVFNTTWGLGGLIDIGDEFNLPAGDEDFGQTLAFYGVPEGNYLMLPLLGPATVSHAIGRIPDSYAYPLTYVDSPWDYAGTGLRVIDKRADILAVENLIQGDRYLFVRNAYLQNREFLINDGKVESDPFLDEELDDY